MSAGVVYNDRQIKEEIKEGHIIIDPFHPEQLGNCSYNLTISRDFFYEKSYVEPITINPLAPTYPQWEKGTPKVATEEEAGRYSLVPGSEYILLAPQDSILVATNEIIGIKAHLTAMIKTRSTIGRSLISVCNGAGWGDVGYVNRWTLMVTNQSRFASMVLPINSSIAQVIFFETGYPDQEYNGKYKSSGKTVDVIRQEWRPEMMLPRSDFRVESSQPSSLEEESEEESDISI